MDNRTAEQALFRVENEAITICRALWNAGEIDLAKRWYAEVAEVPGEFAPIRRQFLQCTGSLQAEERAAALAVVRCRVERWRDEIKKIRREYGTSHAEEQRLRAKRAPRIAWVGITQVWSELCAAFGELIGGFLVPGKPAESRDPYEAISTADSVKCLHCGYDLRAQMDPGLSARCPECGRVFSRRPAVFDELFASLISALTELHRCVGG